ncbi:hypothetical protein D3C78_1402060 [compost metagenome]
MKKIQRQPNPSMSTPPSAGPIAVPMADRVPSSPMALPVLPLATVSPTKARVSAIMTAAPRPCSVLAAISRPRLGARPHSAEANVNRAIPDNSRRRRPTRSPRRPTLTIEVVMASR